MRTSTIRFLTGFIAVAALGFGILGAEADTNGPDAGIGIPGYNLQYNYSADGIGPSWRRNAPEQQDQDSYHDYGPHYYHQW